MTSAAALACDGATESGPPTGHFEIVMHPQNLPGIVDAVWDLQVENNATRREVLYEERLGGGELLDDGLEQRVTVPCDARPESDHHRISLDIIGVYTAKVEGELGEYGAEAPPGSESFHDPSTLTRKLRCVAGETVEVSFDVSLMRPASQGFFDIAINVIPSRALGDALWDLRVEDNATPPEVSFEARISSTQYGDAQGSATFVGHCDANATRNKSRIVLSLAGLYRDVLPGDVSCFSDVPDECLGPEPPAGALPVYDPGTLEREVLCLEDQDVYVQFDVALASLVTEGFFARAVAFAGLECEARLDCPSSDDNDTTLSLGWACLPSPDAAEPATEPTLLWMDLTLACEGDNDTLVIDPSLDLNGTDYAVAVQRHLPRHDGAWDENVTAWRVDLTLARSLLEGRRCVLGARATAEGFGWIITEGELAPGAAYPIISWELPLIGAEGLLCEDAVLGEGDGLSLTYSSFGRTEPLVFPHRFGD